MCNWEPQSRSNPTAVMSTAWSIYGFLLRLSLSFVSEHVYIRVLASSFIVLLSLNTRTKLSESCLKKCFCRHWNINLILEKRNQRNLLIVNLTVFLVMFNVWFSDMKLGGIRIWFTQWHESITVGLNITDMKLAKTFFLMKGMGWKCVMSSIITESQWKLKSFISFF